MIRAILLLMFVCGFESEVQAQAKSSIPLEARLYQIDFHGKLWSQVLDWVSMESQLPIAARCMPLGKFQARFKKDRKYSFTEVLSVINNELQAEDFYLLRKTQYWLFIPRNQLPKQNPGIVQ